MTTENSASKMPSSPLALVSEGLVFLPTPSSAHVRGYRDLFRKLHADVNFCQVAFGTGFPPVTWTDEECKAFMLRGDGEGSWAVRGMGDFALGLLPADDDEVAAAVAGSRALRDSKQREVRIVEGDKFDVLARKLDAVEWVGYTCVREAPVDDADTQVPDWKEMIEMRYGLDPAFRGRGYATVAAEVVMQWAVEEHGTRRFVAETQKPNVKSRQVLTRLGFEESGTDYFKDPGCVEWVKVV